MPREDDPEAPETDEYGQLVDPVEESDVDVDDILEDVEEMSPEMDPRIGEVDLEAESWEERVNQYRTAAEAVGLDPDQVYEPANGRDISAAEAFPESEVTYVEVSEAAVEAVNEEFEGDERVNSILDDGEQYVLDETPDVAVFRNANMDETEAVKNNNPEYVIANDYQKNASGMEEMDGYELVGMVPNNETTTFNETESMADRAHPDNTYVFQKAT